MLLIVVTADRGLCGSFNTNVIKAAGTFVAENAGREVALGLVGRRGRDFFARRGFEVRYEQVNLFAHLQFDDAQAIAQAAIEAFTGGEVDSVYLVYNEFKSVMVAARRRRAAAADPAARDRAGASAGAGRRPIGLPVRAGAGGALHAPAADATSRCRSSARCSSRTPRSTRRR